MAAMIIFPAIDLKQGQCVRLEKGQMAAATIFNDDPLAQANSFSAQGFDWLHVIDLDGATGGGGNATAIKKILANTKLKTQIGGGIRELAHIEKWLALGANRIILGTLALKEPPRAARACRDFPNQIVIALDGVDGKVAIHGWQEVRDETILDAAKRISDWGAAAILFTDIARDGMMVGINIDAVLALSQVAAVPVIAAGGLKSLDDIKKLLALPTQNIEGVIAGRALYDGSLNSAAALALVQDAC